MSNKPSRTTAGPGPSPTPLRLARLGAVVDLVLILVAATIDRFAPHVRER